MTPEDRELLQALRRKQLDLQHSLFRLDIQLKELEARITADEVPEEAPLPPLPTEHLPEIPPPVFPPLPAATEHIDLPLPPLPPPTEDPVHVPKPSLEFQFGKWLTRIGAVFFVLSIIFFGIWADVNYHLHERLGPGGKLGIMGLISVIVMALGQRLERKNSSLLAYGRTLIATGLGGLFFTIYAAHHLEHLRVIASPLLDGVLLLFWSAYVFFLAEKKRSQTLAVFSIFLAYFSTAITPIGTFTMGADLLLAATAVFFMVRHGWSMLSSFSLIFTYLAALRRLVVDENGEIVLDTSRTLHFWPYAIYLTGAWVIFTGAVTLCREPSFRGGKRFIFLSLNNGAFAGLLALTTSISGYDYGQVGESLLFTGFLFLFTSRFVGWAQVEPEKVMAAYAAQGLALVTAGIMVVYTGMTRGVLLMLETFFLGAAAAFSGDIILTVSTYFAAFFATLFLIWEIAANAHHPWLFSVFGGAILLLNAWWARAEIREGPKARSTIVLSSAYYCALALGLIYTAMSTQLSDAALPPDLALVALAFTFSIYLVALYELPPMAQTFLLAAQALVLFPAETGEALPQTSIALVASATLVAVTWWTRQRVTRTGSWTLLLTILYSLTLVKLTYDAIRPDVGFQDWMLAASFLSAAFLAFGAYFRVWVIAATGQIFLAVSVYHFFSPPADIYWTWWAALVPIFIVFTTGRMAHAWLVLSPDMRGDQQTVLRGLAYGYQLLALVMLARWIFIHVPQADQIAAFFFLGTLLVAWNVYQSSSFGIRCGFLLSAIGLVLYVHRFSSDALTMATFLNALALITFLAQPALLRRGKTNLVNEIESWVLILTSVGLGWLFISAWVVLRIHPSYLTMGWALYGFFLFVLGLFMQEKRQRWCGLAIVLAAIIRVFGYDFWGFSNGYRVLTFIVLTIITLGLGFIYARFAERLKTWL